jgi:class 3 adenylate cyclase
MFCDLVGSTPLAARYDPEDLREVTGTSHRCVADTVTRFAGFAWAQRRCSSSSFHVVRTNEQVSRNFPRVADLADHIDCESRPRQARGDASQDPAALDRTGHVRTVIDFRALMAIGPRVTKHTFADVWMIKV